MKRHFGTIFSAEDTKCVCVFPFTTSSFSLLSSTWLDNVIKFV